jgi:hypothetical protein
MTLFGVEESILTPEMKIMTLFGVGESIVTPEMKLVTLFGVGESIVTPEMDDFICRRREHCDSRNEDYDFICGAGCVLIFLE